MAATLLVDSDLIQALINSNIDLSKLTIHGGDSSFYLLEIKEVIKHFLFNDIPINSKVSSLYPSLIQESKIELLQEGLFQACLDDNHSFIEEFTKNVIKPRDLIKTWHKLKIYLISNPSLEPLLACIKYLPIADSSLILLNRLYLDLRYRLGKTDASNLRQKIFDWIYSKIKDAASGDKEATTLNLIVDPSDPPIVTFFAPISELLTWSPEPSLAGSLPICTSVKSLDPLSILFNCLTSSVFIDLYKRRLHKHIISNSTNLKQEYNQFCLLANHLPRHEHMHIEVMLYDWARSKKTGFLIKASAYWPTDDENTDTIDSFPWELPCPEVRQELIKAFQKNSLTNYYPNAKDMALTWCPEDERVRVEVICSDNSKKDIWCSAREYSFLVHELSKRGDESFVIDEKFEKEIDFWFKQGVVDKVKSDNERTLLYRIK